MRLPASRGPISRAVDQALRARTRVDAPDEIASLDESPGDAELALWILHELHYRGFEDVDPDADRRADLLGLRVALENALEARWRERVLLAEVLPADLEAPGVAGAHPSRTGPLPERSPAASPWLDHVAERFFALCEVDAGPSVAAFVQREAGVPQVAEILRQRSIYHVKEQDAATWAVPRVPDETKAHLVAIAADEYGNGRPEALHARMWADGMAAVGLDADYGAYVDGALPEVLEQNNLMSMLGLARRHLPAALGHLAAFEVTSSVPSRRFARGLERLGLPDLMVAYFREHMVADAVHEQVAVRQVLGSYLARHPAHVHDVFWGAAVCLLAEGASGEAILRHVDAAQAAPA